MAAGALSRRAQSRRDLHELCGDYLKLLPHRKRIAPGLIPDNSGKIPEQSGNMPGGFGLDWVGWSGYTKGRKNRALGVARLDPDRRPTGDRAGLHYRFLMGRGPELSSTVKATCAITEARANFRGTNMLIVRK